MDDGRKASTDAHVAIARPNTPLIHPEHLYAYLRGAQGQIQLRSREHGDWKRENKLSIDELNLADLSKVLAPLPAADRLRGGIPAEEGG